METQRWLYACALALAGCYSPPKDACGIQCTTECPDGYRCMAGQCMPDDGTVCKPLSIDFQAFGLGARHACGLDVQGELYCWGDNSEGQLGVGTTPALDASPARVGTDTWSALAVGGAHACAIQGGVVSCWGRNAEGQAEGGAGGNVLAPAPVALSPMAMAPAFETVAAGGVHSCAIGAGQLWCWGASDAIGDSRMDVSFATPVDSTITDWSEVSLGYRHGCAISASQGLWCWGANNAHQAVPDAATMEIIKPTAVALGGGLVVLHVFAKNNGTCAIASTDPTATAGQLWCWGDLPGATLTTPTQLGTDETWTFAAPDGGSPCGVNAGQAECWGYEYVGELGDGFWVQNPPIDISNAKPIGAASVVDRSGSLPYPEAQTRFACLLDGTKLSCWGDDVNGELGQGAPSSRLLPVEITPPGEGLTWKSTAGGDEHTCAIASDDHVYCWGYDGEGAVRAGVARGETQVCLPSEPCDAPLPEPGPAQIGTPDEMRAGYNFTCERENGALHCWGRNNNGELGAGSSSSDAVTTVPPPSGTWTQIFAGDPGSCAVGGGQLECWGVVIGTATTTPMTPSVALLVAQPIVSMQLGDQFGCAALADGSRVCWGDNTYGQLGDGTMNADDNPGAPQEASGVTAVAADYETACELAGGNVWCWGQDSQSQAGQPTPTGSVLTSPAQVEDAHGPLAGCTALAINFENSCAICGGVPECWGYNEDGELGRGTTGNDDPVAAPVQLPSGHTWTGITVGLYHACALDDAGHLFCWGYGPHGEIGDGGHASNFPVTVAP
ncbi:MAG TPA: hypothetical protein VMJ10_34465 [Kofleriaceae bacterium]|nr:hypothetical protein [Kofleriaceae bacterium]